MKSTITIIAKNFSQKSNSETEKASHSQPQFGEINFPRWNTENFPEFSKSRSKMPRARNSSRKELSNLSRGERKKCVRHDLSRIVCRKSIIPEFLCNSDASFPWMWFFSRFPEAVESDWPRVLEHPAIEISLISFITHSRAISQSHFQPSKKRASHFFSSPSLRQNFAPQNYAQDNAPYLANFDRKRGKFVPRESILCPLIGAIFANGHERVVRKPGVEACIGRGPWSATNARNLADNALQIRDSWGKFWATAFGLKGGREQSKDISECKVSLGRWTLTMPTFVQFLGTCSESFL